MPLINAPLQATAVMGYASLVGRDGNLRPGDIGKETKKQKTKEKKRSDALREMDCARFTHLSPLLFFHPVSASNGLHTQEKQMLGENDCCWRHME